MQHDYAELHCYPFSMAEKWQKDYLNQVIEVTGKKLTTIAKDAGVSSTTLTRPMNDPDHKYTIKLSTLEAVARATGIPLPGSEPSSKEPQAPNLRIVENYEPAPVDAQLVPVYDVHASAGYGAINDQELVAHSLAFPPDYLRKLTSSAAGSLAIISVKGESMEPTLLDDDIVLLDATKTNLSYDGLFVLQFNDALHVKRVGRSAKKNHVMIISDNRDLYPPLDMQIGDVQAIGKVLWYGRKV